MPGHYGGGMKPKKKMTAAQKKAEALKKLKKLKKGKKQNQNIKISTIKIYLVGVNYRIC